MIDILIGRVGNWNPQLFRELKSRFTVNTLITTAIVSISIQIFVFASANNPIGSRIEHSLNLLNWMIPLALMLGGVYTIVADLNQEEQRGTLNFIRLTPQSARNIFLGKILGVPGLVYLGVLFSIPFHLGLGLAANFNLATILLWYCTIGVATYLCLSLTILYTLYSRKYAILSTIFFSLPVSTFISSYNYLSNSVIVDRGGINNNGHTLLSWFYIPIGNNIFLFDGFIICTFLLVSYWVWVTIDRKYINLTSTSFKKADSYWMNIQFQIWLLGFALPIVTSVGGNRLLAQTASRSSENFYILATFYTISTIWIFTIVPLILPNKWSIQDWVGDRRKHVTHEHRQKWQQDIIQDLIWHDRSPIGLAMLANLLIPATIWGLSFGIFVGDREWLIKSICGIVIVSTLTLIQTIIISFIFIRSQSRNSGAIPLIILMSVLPLCLGFTGIVSSGYQALGVGLFLCSPLAWMGVTQLSILNIGMIMMGQIGVLAGLTKLFQTRLQKLERSADRYLSPQQAQLVRTNV